MSTRKQQHPVKTFGTIPPSLIGKQVGVWQLVQERSIEAKDWTFHKPSIPNIEGLFASTYIPRFIIDVYHLAPVLFPFYVATFLLLSVNSALQLQYMNRLYDSIEHSLKNGQADVTNIASSLMLRLCSVVLGAMTRWVQERIGSILETRIRAFCRDKIMQRHLSADLLASSDSSATIGDNFPNLISSALRLLFDVFETALSTVAQVAVVLQLLGTQENSWMLGLMCLVRPLLTLSVKQSLWGSNIAYYASDLTYRRLLTMYRIATDGIHKQEVLSGGLKHWILGEFRSAQEHTKNKSDKNPESLYYYGASPAYATSLALSGDLPFAFYVIAGLMDGRNISLTFLATLQHMTASLRSAIESLTWSRASVGECTTFLEGLYAEPNRHVTTETTGYERYPLSEKQKGGMSVEFKNVEFEYPGSKDGVFAVNNVSFAIPSSSLVVIVGENGSGKSSIVKLLTQLYAPSKGSILIDGLDSKLYKKDSLYAAIALLTQDHTIFPLSISENIGIGNPDDVHNMSKIVRAARLGGASGFIEKRKNRYCEVLHPLRTLQTCRYQLPDGPLKTFTEEVERHTEVSGGEKQRLAAARTFMRLMSDKVKLVVVDEPTSAMDPTGEFELFETLRSMRAGKTMVFVTHRFGHLTKHADLILCMKDGVLVESGTHRTLMGLNGVYSSLYDVQARAFADETQIG